MAIHKAAPSQLEAKTFKGKCTLQSLTFIRSNFSSEAASHQMLRNNMLFGAMFLECANAGDLAANVWNETPTPIFARVLMGIGGSLALLISSFAFRDAILSWSNTVLLRRERQHLLQRRSSQDRGTLLARDLEVRLEMNFRETGVEWMNRFGMDVLLGFGAVIVGVGTLLAIGGRNPTVFQVSNLLSGYIGNGPAALWGLSHVAWCILIWNRMRQHQKVAERHFEKNSDIRRRMLRRVRNVKRHMAIYGSAGFIVGMASLVSATNWWGYVILGPCLIVTICCNFNFRRSICYSRVSIEQMSLAEKDAILLQLKGISSLRRILTGAGSASLTHLNSEPMTFATAMRFILCHGLFADFCTRLIEDEDLTRSIFGEPQDVLVIRSHGLLLATGKIETRLRDLALVCIGDVGVRFISRDHEVFLLDLLGCLLSLPSEMNFRRSSKDDIETM
ncbi:hypothetical protein BJ878DRAFT_430839 [Calycina marina]|uniref:Transmembrane protein n=1 Tax=Calycina marina TaxID=1763456 RepID=A0A9P7YVV5_9HELO|nr:hypothetical protein BJ878DRAFT_430839 [Calycina marina]